MFKAIIAAIIFFGSLWALGLYELIQSA